MLTLLKLTNRFYDAAWDFSTNLCLLPEQLNLPPKERMNIDKLIDAYKAENNPFLNLTGKDIPRDLHPEYDQIDAK